MKIGKIHGMTFSIHFLFFPIMVSLYMMGYAEEMLILLAIIMIHELSHGLMAITLGIKIREIQILPFGGVIKLDNTLSFTYPEEIMISAAGPIANVILSVAVFFLQESFSLQSNHFDFIIFSSLVIGIFNLMPALPLDGGRIFRAALSYLLGYKKATRVVTILSKVLAVLLIVLNIYLFSLGSYNFTFVLVGIFIYYQAGKENEIAIYSTMKDIAAKKENLSKSGSMVSQHMTVLPETTLGEIFKQFTSKKFHIIYVLDEEYALKGIITEDEILTGILHYGMYGKVKNILEKRNKY